MRYLVLLLLALVSTILSGCGKSDPIEKGIVLRGHGEVRALPDVAELRLNIVTRNMENNSSKAIDANAEKVNSVRSALVSLGVKAKEITNESFEANTQQAYDYYHDRPKGKPYFRVSHCLLVTTKDVPNLGKMIDASIKAGASSVESVDYRFDNPAKLQAEAMARAVKDAKIRARAVADAGGVTLLPISSVVQAGLEDRNYAAEAGDMRYKVMARKNASPTPHTYTMPKEEVFPADVTVTFAVRR